MHRIIQFWKSGIAGKLVIGCGGLVVLLFACAALSLIFGPRDSTQEAAQTPAPTQVIAETEATAAPIVTQPPAATSTPKPTDTPRPTNTPQPTNTPKPTSTPQPIDVEFSVNVRTESGKVHFDVETNLPDGMQFMFTVEGSDGILGQSNAEVKAGTMSVGPFSQKGEPYPPGEYTVSISSPLLQLQPPEVQLVLGESGENVRGEYVSEGRVDFTMPFTIEGSQSQLQQLAELKAKELQSLQAHLSFLKEMESELAKAASPANFDEFIWVTWSADWNKRLEGSKDAYGQELGSNINEYKGYCRDAFFEIAVGYSDLFVLWLDYDNFLEGQGDKSTLDKRKADFEQLLNDAHSGLDKCRENP